MKKTGTAWGIHMEANNKLDGWRAWLDGTTDPHHTRLFHTRREAREFIRERYAYFKRSDLRKEPHGWRIPQPVKVTISMEWEA